MKDIVILPFEVNPKLKNYQLKAYELGIIQANEKSIVPWIYNKYINQLYMIKDKRFTYTNYDRWHATEGVMECQKLCISNRFLQEVNCLELLSFIKEQLMTHHYVYGRYNEYYIRAKGSYQKSHYIHDFLVFGFNETKKVFLSAGYTARGKYEQFEIAYNEFLSALIGTVTEKLNFHFLKYKNGIENRINLREICEDLYDYIHSINRRNIVNEAKIFGIDCEAIFLTYMQEVYAKNPDTAIDMRHPKFFAELKSLMFERLLFLSEIGYLPQGYASEYKEVAAQQQLIVWLSIKYNVTKDLVLLKDIFNYEKNIITKEKRILCPVYEELTKILKR